MTVVLDVTELISNPVRTGIQRVVRELICRWPENAPMRLARYDAGGLVAVPDAAIELITDRAPNTAGLPVNEIAHRLSRLLDRRAANLPINDRIFVPEVFFEGRRCAYYQARLEADRNAVGFVVYDFIPWLYPDSIGVAQSAPFMPYLRLLRSTQRLAFISNATRRDYAQRVMRGRGADGPVLALGCDELGLARQRFTSDRRGFLCIGSIDGRRKSRPRLARFPNAVGAGA